MKRLFYIFSILLVIYVIYFDISVGTIPPLPTTSSQVVETETKEQSLTYFEKKVTHGDTVLSIIETHLNGSIPMSIEQVIRDFEDLNNGTRPEKIQYGKTYRFPNYEQPL